MRILDFLDDLESHLRLPPFLFRMVRVWGIVLYVVHAFTCIYWLTKLLSNEDEEMAVWYSQVRAPLHTRLSLSLARSLARARARAFSLPSQTRVLTTLVCAVRDWAR